jgi:hypothetical protein
MKYIYRESPCELGLYQFFLAFKAEFGNLAARSGPSIFSTVTNFALKYRPERRLWKRVAREKRRVGVFYCHCSGVNYTAVKMKRGEPNCCEMLKSLFSVLSFGYLLGQKIKGG